ncbi:hypothetical protein Enr10x_31870 [Gimesia panareensis]|uniref:Wadjet protein JetD C-terminal domain-containing protein n=1 Tax=Gimesia panareensis TaxID=2527978 RepID=A0A517Q893_9PLAN|nr:DUF3322 domain-containing protein [Gimesia panareensis]QDT27852.1 hypothetical protein Enr10x_31870 [Gimesia panareensis]
MKSPAELTLSLRRQWENADKRETRLLGGENAWPVIHSIGLPTSKEMFSDLDSVKRHVNEWRQVNVGEVIWEGVRYRATSGPVEMPVQWKLQQPTEWINACADQTIHNEFKSLTLLAEQTDPLFHSLLIRRRSLWLSKRLDEVVQAAHLAMELESGCAAGTPLRAISLGGIDTKFFERNARLVTALLDTRFDDEVSRIGIEAFLGAISEGDHWLLLMDLDGSLLPFRRQRVRSSELRESILPGKRLLIIENESCQHQLPDVPETIAVLGSGFDLGWIEGHRLQERKIGYWGDIDTWGLQFLAKARLTVQQLDALMMTSEVYEQHSYAAVPEPIIAGVDLPTGLSNPERALYKRLLKEPKGRLEQEFLPQKFIRETILSWANS